MSQEFHQGVDTDVGVGEFSGEGVAETMNKCAGGSFAVDARLLKARRSRYCRVPRVMRSPSAPRKRGAVGVAAEAAARAKEARRITVLGGAELPVGSVRCFATNTAIHAPTA